MAFPVYLFFVRLLTDGGGSSLPPLLSRIVENADMTLSSFAWNAAEQPDASRFRQRVRPALTAWRGHEGGARERRVATNR
jgi:hypothetical protein